MFNAFKKTREVAIDGSYLSDYCSGGRVEVENNPFLLLCVVQVTCTSPSNMLHTETSSTS